MQPASKPTTTSPATADRTAPPVDCLAAARQRSNATHARVEVLAQAGYRCVPLNATLPKQLAYRGGPRKQYIPKQFDGHLIGIRTGRLADGSYLVRLDIDQHGEEQDAEAAYARLLPFIEAAPGRFAVKRSTNGKGYDVIFRAQHELPNNQHFFIDGCHAGEIFCEGGWVRDDGWIHGAPEALIPLSNNQLAHLQSIVVLRGLNTEGAVFWKIRAREGTPFIRGYKEVDSTPHLHATGMPKTFQGTAQKHRIAQKHWDALKRASKGERSDAYARFLTSVVLLATKRYGDSLEEKCRTIAAIAIVHDPRQHDKGLVFVEDDTAALIMRCFHGDPYKNRSGHFPRPYWADGYQVPLRPRGRPQGDRQAKLKRLRRLLRKHLDGDRVEGIDDQKLTNKLLAHHLNVTVRTVRDYLAKLEANGEIQREAMHGRGGRQIIHILPMFDNCTIVKTKAASSSTHATKEAEKCPERRIINAQKGGSRGLGFEDQDAEEVTPAGYILHRESAAVDDDGTDGADDQANTASYAQCDDDKESADIALSTFATDTHVDPATEKPCRRSKEELDPVSPACSFTRGRPLEEEPRGPSTEDEWNDVHIGHTMRLLSAGTYGGARLQAGAIRTPELRRSYIRYVDECCAAALAGAYDDERLYAAAAD